MKAFSHATSSVRPKSLKLQYIFGLHEHPSTILIGACDPDLDGLCKTPARCMGDTYNIPSWCHCQNPSDHPLDHVQGGDHCTNKLLSPQRSASPRWYNFQIFCQPLDRVLTWWHQLTCKDTFAKQSRRRFWMVWGRNLKASEPGGKTGCWCNILSHLWFTRDGD